MSLTVKDLLFTWVVDATLTIENLGKSLNVQVITISFGVPSQLVEAVRVLRDVKGTSKKWLILENCHLVKDWSREFLRLIEVRNSTRIRHCEHIKKFWQRKVCFERQIVA